MARVILLLLHAFVAISAIAGAVWVVPTMPLEWIRSGPFTDWTIPALALGSVGVLAGVAFAAVLLRPRLGAPLSVAVGVAMVVFELVEIAVVGWTLGDPTLPAFQASLQLVYIVVGSVQVLLGVALWASLGRSLAGQRRYRPT
jgi:hypothetical protein